MQQHITQVRTPTVWFRRCIDPPPTFLSTVIDIVLTAGLVIAFSSIADVPGFVCLQSVAILAVFAMCMAMQNKGFCTGFSFGPADRITLVRAGIAALCAGFLFHGDTAAAMGWWLPLIAGFAFILDGADGWVARRTGTASDFGAQFDIETDAFLTLALSGLVWQLGKVGYWVLGIGALHYLLLAAYTLLPGVTGELFTSRRRKVIGAMQVVALGICLLPAIGPGAAAPVAGLALVTLVFSFGIDAVWLMQRKADHTLEGRVQSLRLA
ncbi:MAG: CDP-alcohol phosphatidyltransferase family protein [Hyphomicrobiaceae bacterium]